MLTARAKNDCDKVSGGRDPCGPDKRGDNCHRKKNREPTGLPDQTRLDALSGNKRIALDLDVDDKLQEQNDRNRLEDRHAVIRDQVRPEEHLSPVHGKRNKNNARPDHLPERSFECGEYDARFHSIDFKNSSVDPAGLAPAYLPVKSSVLLHIRRALESTFI